MIRCAPWVSWVPGAAAITLFDDRDGSYHALNSSASLIWTALNDGAQPTEIGPAIARQRGMAASTIQPDVDAFVALALDKGLLISD